MPDLELVQEIAEAAARQQIAELTRQLVPTQQALAYPNTAAMLEGTSLYPRQLAGGRQGGTFELLAANDQTPVDGGMVLLRADGRKLARQAAPDGIMSLAWWGIVGDGVTSDAAAIALWVTYAAAKGGKFALLPGMQVKGKIHIGSPQRHLTLIGYGASILSDETDTPVLFIDRAPHGGAILGLRVNMPSVGTSPPLSHDPELEPRRTFGGHGILIRHAHNWHIGGCTAQGLASMGIVMLNVSQYTVIGNTVNVVMADGIHSTLGCRDGVISGNTVRHTGDDGIPVVSYRAWGGHHPDGVAANALAPTCQNIALTGNVIEGTGARGITIAGGMNIAINGNVIDTTYMANIYILKDPVFDSHPCVSVVVNGGVCRGAGQYNGGDTRIAAPAAIIVEGDCYDVTLAGALEVAAGRGPGLSILADGVTVGDGVRIHDNAGDGVRALTTGLKLSARIRYNGGHGVVASGASEVLMQSALVEHNSGVGLLATDASRVTVQGSAVARNTASGSNAQVSATGTAQITLMGTRVRGTAQFGVVANTGTTIDLISCDVRGGGSEAGAVSGPGGTLTSRGSLGQVDAPAPA